jgi:hypothetical protein
MCITDTSLRAKSQEWWRQVLSWISTIKKEFGYGAIVSTGYRYLQDIGKDLCEAIGGSIYAHFINSRGYVCIPDPTYL